MEFADRLGVVALLVAFLGLGITILWPTKRWIGWTSLGLATILGMAWARLEFAPKLKPETDKGRVEAPTAAQNPEPPPKRTV